MTIGIALTILVILTYAPADSVADLGFTRLFNDDNLPAISILEESSKDGPRSNETDWIRQYDDAPFDDRAKEAAGRSKDESDATSNCTERSVDEFPEAFTLEQRRRGAAALHIFFGFYCFILTAFVCNDYLLPTLDIICVRLNISSDVAGATFLATANCFPELFVNVIGTFLTESDLGIGTVMGGAVFNTFATPACGALSAIHAIPLERRILTRDCILYAISVATLVIVMWDGVIKLYEAIILMVLFVTYLTILFCSKYFVRWHNKLVHLYTDKNRSFSEKEIPKGKEESMPDGLYRPYFHGELVAEYRKKSVASNSGRKSSSANDVETPNHVEQADEYVEPDTPFVWPTGGSLAKVWFWFVWPLKLILFVTVPDSRYKRWRDWYLITFVMCVIWIAISSYLTSWMTTVLGDTIGIPDSVMGITFQAAGGNMPELVSIVILSRQGNGDMAMSNTLGANTLDILLCLGLPWMIKILMDKKDIKIISYALSYSVLSIIVCVIAFYTVTAFCKYRLNKKVGIICLTLYAIFLVFALLFELNIFSPVNLPMCSS
ncbi:sodium potassium calcium exchanger 4-like protein [Lasius niger]|uniref:Sodium potassium calcium exchanger 4-like protein n=1 Tax=Lasius niger TaxID=67767 RepID=A0A0J7KWE7_LASNI|nr:sodium potassium calcium exchanger 4-like protein [Lasius niger]